MIRSALFPLGLYHRHDHPFHCRRSTICRCNRHPISHRSPIVVPHHQINNPKVENNGTHAAAMKREIRKELGVKIEVKGYFMFVVRSSAKQSQQLTCHHPFSNLFLLIVSSPSSRRRRFRLVGLETIFLLESTNSWFVPERKEKVTSCSSRISSTPRRQL